MGRSASVGGWVRRYQWVARVGFVMVGVGVAADQPQTHVVDRSACLPIEWVSSDFLLCLVWVEEKIGGFFFFFGLLWTVGGGGGGGGCGCDYG